jgi:hypothetical protein
LLLRKGNISFLEPEKLSSLFLIRNFTSIRGLVCAVGKPPLIHACTWQLTLIILQLAAGTSPFQRVFHLHWGSPFEGCLLFSFSGEEAITFESSLARGFSGSSLTFNNPPLCDNGVFESAVVEVYAFVDAM